MTTNAKNWIDSVQPRPLHMYHRYKHQRATQHLVDLYKTFTNNNYTEAEKAIKSQAVIELIKNINSRIRELNAEFNLPLELGVIDYGAFIFGWQQKKDRALIRRELEGFCKRKQYMEGWSRLPPTHDYGYFLPAENHRMKQWDVVLPWLRLIWSLLRQHSQPDLIDELEAMLIRYTINEKFSSHSNKLEGQFDVLGGLISLHELNKLLNKHENTSYPAEVESAYEQERQQMLRMCEFYGYPLDWIPAAITVQEQKSEEERGEGGLG